ncbi:MAG: Rid family hydrolase [Burkholderiaceae bacterium]|jgi:reactive intermediate/imine deaminase
MTTERRGNNERRSVGERRNDTQRRDVQERRAGSKAAPRQPKKSSLAPPAFEAIHPKGVFDLSAFAPLSAAVKTGNLVFVSGVPAYDAKGGLAVGDFAAQMTQVLSNVSAILAAAGCDWSHVVKANVLLTRREDFAQMNRLYAAHFPAGHYPARTTAIVYSLPHPDFLIEIECVASLN